MKYLLRISGPIDLSDLGVPLCGALRQAVQECPGVDEEEGGFIVHRGKLNEDGAFEFHRITNVNSGTPAAAGLYEPVKQEYGDKVITSYNRGFCNYASFHTHPTGYPARPSLTDLTRLFNGQPVNYICSPSLRELKRYTFVNATDDLTTWQVNEIDFDRLTA